MNNTEDGGYFAIKGFVYQIDKTILEILDNPNEEIFLERIQDIDYNATVIQVKYKETATYYPSSIGIPVLKLLKLYSEDTARSYNLYCYFLNEKEGKKILTLQDLDTILGEYKSKYTPQIKKAFLKNFSLCFSKHFDEHLVEILKRLKTTYLLASDDEAIIVHALILDHLLKKITQNDGANKDSRKTSKNEIDKIIVNNKKVIFHSSYKEFLGDKKYYELIKKNHFSWKNISDFERFILVELHGSESVLEIKETIIQIKNKFYCKTNRIIKSGAPYIYLKNCKPKVLKKVKSDLFEEGNIFRDGHDYLDSSFSFKHLLIPSTKENDISLKFLNNERQFKNTLSIKMGKTRELYQFYITSPINFNLDIKETSIQVESISEINNMF